MKPEVGCDNKAELRKLRDQLLGGDKASGSGGAEDSEVSDDFGGDDTEAKGGLLKRPAVASSTGKSSRQKTDDDKAHDGKGDEENEGGDGDAAAPSHFPSFDAAMSNLPPIFDF